MHLRTLGLGIALVTATTALTPLTASAETTLRFGHVFAENSLENDAINQFADAVRERTDGEIDVQVYPAGQLGDVGQTWQELSQGTMDMSFVDVSLLGYVDGHEEFFVGQVPYLFESQDAARKVYNSDVFAPMYERLREEKGIRVLAVRGDRAPRSINTTEGPIFGPEDAEGIKIRVLPNPVSIATFEAWGMEPTPIAFNELYMSLRQGVVEGQDNGLDVTVPSKFFEVTDYFAFSNHVRSLYGWYASERSWQNLSEEHRDIVVDEVGKAGEMITRLGQDREERQLNTMLEAGMQITIPNRPAFRELSKDVYQEFEGDLWREGLVEEIRAMQED